MFANPEDERVANFASDIAVEIESQGESFEKLREEVKKEMIIARVQRGMVGPKVFISEQELNNFIKSTDGQNLLVIEYKFDQILVKNIEDANKIIASLKSGENFETPLLMIHFDDL